MAIEWTDRSTTTIFTMEGPVNDDAGERIGYAVAKLEYWNAAHLPKGDDREYRAQIYREYRDEIAATVYCDQPEDAVEWCELMGATMASLPEGLRLEWLRLFDDSPTASAGDAAALAAGLLAAEA